MRRFRRRGNETAQLQLHSSDLSSGIGFLLISGSDCKLGSGAPIYSPTKSIADALRNPKLVDWPVGIESMKPALANRKATPAELHEAAREYRAATRSNLIGRF